jgi:hypothetical protein
MIQELNVTTEEVRSGVAQVVGSQTLRGKETLQRLLAYLAERTLDGSASSLKEYTIGVEVFGKPADYDPQTDASVRVQIGRLRQKLEEYARTEGVNDPLLIELPKRQFALQFHPQPLQTVPSQTLEITEPTTLPVAADKTHPPVSPASPQFSRPALLLGGLLGGLLMALLWAGWSFWQSRAISRSPAAITVRELPAELSELWQPFLTSRRPLTMAMTMRPFLRYDQGVIWDWRLTSLDGEARAARLREIQQQLKTERIVPWEKTYTSFGEATGIFLLTQFFERQGRALQLKRSDALTWEEISEQDVIFVGAGKAGVPFERIPVQLAFEQKPLSNTIRNLYPQEGELAEYVTPPPDPKDFMQQEDYALISVVPGLHGKGAIIAFGAASSSGLWAAVEFMTEPRYARELLAKLKSNDGQLPRHYQVIIHARFQSLVPVEITYVTHRQL